MDDEVTPRLAEEATALLLADIGMQAAYRFAQQLRELGLLPSHAGILKALDSSARLNLSAQFDSG